MLHLKDLTKQYGDRTLFSDVTLFINKNDRIGLVGSNGTGKSTFLKIIYGSEQSTGGTIYKSNEITFGYLPQEMNFYSANNLLDEVLLSFPELTILEKEIDILHRKLSEEPHDEKILEKLGNFDHKLQSMDAYNIHLRAKKILNGLGFKEKDLVRKVDEFSGGWKMRILLAKLLLIDPSVLLLDEPTNHLDLDSLEWLEDYLNNYKGTVIIISHDKSFLNNLTKRTFEISNGKLTEYRGNYSFYEEESTKRKELLSSAYKNQQDKIRQTERFIERFRYKATKARQVQSRIKQLEKIDFIEPDDDEDAINFSFPEPKPSGRVVIETSNLTKSYNDLPVFENANLTIERSDRIAIVGPNGAGKSTLLRILADIEPTTSGKITSGYNVIKSYFAQEQSDELDHSKNILETIEEVATGDIRKRIRTILGSFLFSDDEVFKSISVLSGGEKSRVALAKMLLTPANFLIMDEPTNHLDMKSKEILQNALNDFSGTFIIASHDRDFLNPIINKVLEVRDNYIRVFPGNLTDYSYHKKQIYADEQKKSSLSQTNDSFKPASTSKEKKRMEAEIRQKKYLICKPLKDKLGNIETKILELEERNTIIETLLGNPEIYKNGEEVKGLNQEYVVNKDDLTRYYKEWEICQLDLEKMEQSIAI